MVTLAQVVCTRLARLVLAFVCIAIAPVAVGEDCRRAGYEIAWREVEYAPVTRVSDAEVAAGEFPYRSGDPVTARRALTSIRWRLCASDAEDVPRVPSGLVEAIRELAGALPDDLLEQIRRNRFPPARHSAGMRASDGEWVSLDQLATSLSALWALDDGHRGARLYNNMIEADLLPGDLLIAAAGARESGNYLLSELEPEMVLRLFQRIDAIGPTSATPSQCSRVAAAYSVAVEFPTTHLERVLTVVVCDAPQVAYMFRHETGWEPLDASEVCALLTPQGAPAEGLLKRLVAGVDCTQRLREAPPAYVRVVSAAQRTAVIDAFGALDGGEVEATGCPTPSTHRGAHPAR